MRRKSSKKYIALISALILIFAPSTAAFADVETDEFGVAYILNEDGSRNYDVTGQKFVENTDEVQGATVREDVKHYELIVNGPTKDQSTVGIPADMTAEQFAALSDGVIQWDEIQNIVRYKNPTYVRYFTNANASIIEMQSAYEEFKSQMKENIAQADTAIEGLKKTQQILSSVQSDFVPMNGTIMSKDAALNALSAGLDAAQKGRQQAAAAIGTTQRSLAMAPQSVERALGPLRNQMISVVQALIIQYKTLLINRSLVAEQIELYDAMYTMQANMQAQGLGTVVTTSDAYNKLSDAKKNMTALDSGLEQLKKNILMQCGYDPNASVEIADLPAPDVNYLNGRDYEADKKLAVDGNSAVITAGQVSTYENSSYGMKLRDMGENEARGKASSAMDALHNELQRQLILADSAKTTLQKAELMSASAKVKYDTGMIGRTEYEGEQMKLISSRASAKTAELNLHQAILNYEWAMRGIMSIE